MWDICPFGPEFLALAGAIGDGALPMCTPPESAALMCQAIHAGAAAAGRDPQALDVMGFVWVSVAADGPNAGGRSAGCPGPCH